MEKIKVRRPGEGVKLIPLAMWNMMANKYGLEPVAEDVPTFVLDQMQKTAGKTASPARKKRQSKAVEI